MLSDGSVRARGPPQSLRPVINARDVAPGTEIGCDLCVVGAGPAGIAIADRLRESGLTVVLVESGGFDPELPTQRLFRGTNVGHDYYHLDACRFRVFGGSTNRWGGWCRPLERVDFSKREWLPYSGWPITNDALVPYQADTAALFELTDARFDFASWRDRLPAPFSLDDTDFESVFFQYSPETNFGEAYRARLLASSNVKIVIYANLTRIELDADSRRVGRLWFSTLTGRTCSVVPKAVVLAAGGLENARLLLASDADRPTGIGNEHGNVGRFFQEHLHVPAGHLLVRRGASSPRFYRKAAYNGVIVRGVIAPTPAAQERHRLPATSIAIETEGYNFGTPFLGWPPAVTFPPINAYRRYRTGRFREFAETLKRNAERASGLTTRLRTWQRARAARAAGDASPDERAYSVYFRSEQVPDPDSRVTLSRRRDALGMPEITLDWRVNQTDIDAITGWLAAFDRDVRSRRIIGGPHHIGTTRMSADARSGVVDEHCRVHSVANLYVAGSSVFATGGYANPTFTLVALALRLADTLRERLREKSTIGSVP
jgi:choline dehydrogenase-like flavoprotein